MASWSEIQEKISAACLCAGRSEHEIHVLPVSKGQNYEQICKALAQKGFPRRLGESYLEELEQKRSELSGQNLEWHFIGRLQSRKIPGIVENATVLHTVARSKELEEIAKHCAKGGQKIPQFFLQVNVSDEDSKNGLLPSALAQMVDKIEELGLGNEWRGLMTMAAPLEEVGEGALRRQYAELRALRDSFCPTGELSMGVSTDYEIAILEGANWLRLGTSLFGQRTRG